jgi:hypothetical protein
VPLNGAIAFSARQSAPKILIYIFISRWEQFGVRLMIAQLTAGRKSIKQHR